MINEKIREIEKGKNTEKLLDPLSREKNPHRKSGIIENGKKSSPWRKENIYQG